MIFSCMPSDEIYEEVNTLSYLISVYKNPQLFWDIDLPDEERFAIIDTLENMFMELVS